MANTLELGNGKWATGKDTVLAFNDENNNFKPLPFSFSRNSSGTVVNKEGLIETVGVGEPRIDFKDNTKGALLLEPERRNSLLQSNQFDTTWSLSSSISLTSGQSGVGGSTDAWLLKKTDASSRYINQSITLSSSTYSYSVFAKKESGNWLYVRLADSGGSLASTSYFDLENGVVGSTSANSLSTQSYNNGWYRCEIKFTHSIGNVRMYPAVGNGSPSGGSGGEGIYIQYAQLEEGSYATSYIPTSGSAVTRVLDTCYNDNLANVIGQTEGTFYLETVPLNSLTSYTERVIQFESSGSGFMTIQRYANSNITFYGTNGSNNWSIQGTGFFVGGQTIKIAGAYKDNDITLYVNGVQIGTNTTANAPQTEKLRFANNPNGSLGYLGSHKDVKLYNTRLSNSELAALTTI